VLARTVAIRETLGDGDSFGAAQLAQDLEHDVAAWIAGFEDAKPTTTRFCCPECGLQCRWPERLEDHLRNVHWIETA